jgi:tRNA pseudouridine38-40 synthase
MHNIKLVIAYDGTSYLGWQKTRMGPSIEATLQAAIEQIMQDPAPLQAASRTDAGVHAQGQVVNFHTSKSDLDLLKLRISLNSLLPKDIVVLQAELMPTTFHPTLDCIGKEYRYYLCYGPTQLPNLRFYSWHVPYLLNVDLMRQALPLLIGKHDFTTFCNVKKNAHYTNHVREVQLLEINELEDKRLCFRIKGNHFLYKMVRNIVGSLVYIGRGKISLEQLPAILQSHSRPKAGMTAPAHGLFLHQVFYQI